MQFPGTWVESDDSPHRDELWTGRGSEAYVVNLDGDGPIPLLCIVSQRHHL